MNGNIANLSALSAIPLASVASCYGLKTAGVVHLMNEQPESPCRYEVPAGFAIEVDSYKEVSDADLKGALDSLSGGMLHGGAVLVRSSSVDEKPGQYETLFVHVDAHEPLITFKRFQRAVRRVCGSAKGMGALIMPMVGAATSISDNDGMLGINNVSFVADTHSIANGREMYIAFVNGVATRAVDMGKDFIPVTVERESGRITSFVNRTDRAALSSSESMLPVKMPVNYRQQRFDYFSLRTGKLAVADLLDPALGLVDERGELQRPGMMIKDGAIRLLDLRREGMMSYEDFVRSGLVQCLGFTPFASPAQLMNLIGILRDLAFKSEGPIQVEGAFRSPYEEIPYLFQHVDVPSSPVSNVNVLLEGADVGSKNVVGICNARVPFFALENVSAFTFGMPALCDDLRRLDERFRKTGYALLASHHNAQVIELTPHCRIRLSLGKENMASHAATYARILQARAPHKSSVLASEVELSEAVELMFKTLPNREPSSTSWGIAHLLSREALIRSNGRVLSIDLDPPERSKPPSAPPVSEQSETSFMSWFRSLFRGE